MKELLRWQVGDVRITRVQELEAPDLRFVIPEATVENLAEIAWLGPFRSPNGHALASVHTLILEIGERRIAVDTCIGNDKQNRGVPTWNNLQLPFLEDMTKAGYPPESIDTVFCTHLHIDHVGWNTKLVNGKWVPTFEKARYIFVKPEYEYWRENAPTPAHAAVFEDSVKPIMDANLAELVAPTARICDELTLISTPGHSPGHVSIHIKSDGAEGLLTGDVFHHPCQMWHTDWAASPDSDIAQSGNSKREVCSRFADTRTLVIGGHFGAGYIKRDGDRFKYFAA